MVRVAPAPKPFCKSKFQILSEYFDTIFKAHWTWRGNMGGITTVSGSGSNVSPDLAYDGNDNTFWHSKQLTGEFIYFREKFRYYQVMKYSNFEQSFLVPC